MDDRYEVAEVSDGKDSEGYDTEVWVPVFDGSLSDCEAYIRLHEGGYM